MTDRAAIARGLDEGWSLRRIAERIGRDVSVVSRQIARNCRACGYRSVGADVAAQRRKARPRTRRIDARPVLRARVLAGWTAGCFSDWGYFQFVRLLGCCPAAQPSFLYRLSNHSTDVYRIITGDVLDPAYTSLKELLSPYDAILNTHANESNVRLIISVY